jgi:hypothetical protein
MNQLEVNLNKAEKKPNVKISDQQDKIESLQPTARGTKQVSYKQTGNLNKNSAAAWMKEEADSDDGSKE